MTAVILEDELFTRNRLIRLINQTGYDIEIVAQFDKVSNLANFLISNEKQPDLIFLDIQVADGDGFELFHLLDVQSKVIFTTAYNQYAVAAFRHNAIDYLMKPIKLTELKQAISKCSQVQPEQLLSLNPELTYKQRFLVRFGKKFSSIKVKDIAYIYSKEKISYFYQTNQHRVPSDYRLQTLEPLLDPKIFFRANRQLIVNIEAIKQISRHDSSRLKLDLIPPIGEQIIVSTERTKSFKKWMER